MDIGGFETMINKVGGIDIVSPSDIVDPTYDWLDGSPYGFSLSAGPIISTAEPQWPSSGVDTAAAATG